MRPIWRTIIGNREANHGGVLPLGTNTSSRVKESHHGRLYQFGVVSQEPIDNSFASNEMNIVFMGNFPYPSGFAATKRIQSFIDYLCSINIIPTVLILRQGGEQVSASQLEDYHYAVRYRTIGYGLSLRPSVIYKLPLFFLGGSLSLIKWRQRRFSNYLYCYNGLDIENVFFVLVAKALGYYIIFDVVEDFSYLQDHPHFLAKLKNKTWIRLDRLILEVADGLVVISKHLKNKYDQRNNKSVPIHLIPISAKCDAACDTAITISDGSIKFVYSGSFGEKDDLLTLIAAFKNVQGKRQTIKLLLSGRGRFLDLVKDNIRGNKSIEYVGYLPEKEFYEFLKGADVLCMLRTNSRYANAGFPFKLGEYLATGKPVIASNVGDVSHYLRNGQDALLVEPGDVDALERAMEYCIDNYDAAVRIGRNGMKKCKTFFSPNVNGKLLLELMMRLNNTGNLLIDRIHRET